MKNFEAFGLHPSLLKVLNQKKIHQPTEIQVQSIPFLLKHEGDFLGRSATGTGKTLAFALPLLHNIDSKKGIIQAVVLVPTRELCEQVGNQLIDLSSEMFSLKVEAIYGGVPLKAQIHELSNGVQVLVATPGRLVDLINRNVINLSFLKYVVFDEADEMLLKGFTTDIDKILSVTDRSFSTWLFSATMPEGISHIVKKYLNKELVKIQVDKNKKTNQSIVHYAVKVSPDEKLSVLLHYLSCFSNQRGVVFCRTKSGVQKLYKQLSSHKISSGAIHGDLPQGLRNKVMDQYREGNIDVLIATDVAARGVDVQEVSYVIQYQTPDTKEAYIHRSGRTSRVGNEGVCYTLVFDDELTKFQSLINELAIEVEWLEKPKEKDQLINKAILWAKKVAKEKLVSTHLSEHELFAFKNALNHLSKEELLEKLIANKIRELQN